MPRLIGAPIWQEIVGRALFDVAPERGDDPGGSRAAEPERVADRDHPVAYLGAIALPPCHAGKIFVGIDLEESDVGLLVAADHLRGVPAVVLKDYRHLVGIGDEKALEKLIERRAAPPECRGNLDSLCFRRPRPPPVPSTRLKG